MYTPQHFAETDDAIILELVRSTGFGHLVCQSGDGLMSTPVPFVVDDDLTSVRAHLAKANQAWRAAPCQALLIIPVADAYISPGWYPSKAEHGKVVPTWNYEVVQLHGELIAHDEHTWLQTQLGDLTDHNEAGSPKPWSVDDAPGEFIATQSKAIVGIEILVDRVEAKRKLSQNRSAPDQAGVISGLASQAVEGSPIGDAMTAEHRVSEPGDVNRF